MLTYIYKCDDCDEISNIKATVKEKQENIPEIFKCKNCGSGNMQQMISSSNVITNTGHEKGSGCGKCSCGGCRR